MNLTGVDDPQQLMLSQRHGRINNTFIKQCDIQGLHSFLSKSKRIDNQLVFQLPYHLIGAGERVSTWSSNIQVEQLIFDLRQEH